MKEKKLVLEKTNKFLLFFDYMVQINTLILIAGAGFVLFEFQH